MSLGGGGGGGLPGTPKVAGGARKLATGMVGTNLGKNEQGKIKGIGKTSFNLAKPTSAVAAPALAGANTAAGYGNQAASDASGLAHSFVPNAQRIMDLGFDPQDALKQRTEHDLLEKTRVGQAARGVSMSPYGAGLEADALKNFDIDWENNALDRATAAATSAEGLGTTALDLGKGATNLEATASRLPYDTRQGFLGDQATALDRVSQGITAANAPRQQVISDFLNYLGASTAQQNADTSSQQANTSAITGFAQLIPSLIGK